MATPPTRQVELPYNFAPRSYQRAVFDAFYREGLRRFCSVWHRRSGKGKTYLNLMVDQMMTRVGNYNHVFPLATAGRRIIWHGIDGQGKRYLDHFPPELIYRKSEANMLVQLIHPHDASKPGSTYQIFGTDKNLDALVGSNAIGVIWDEFALQNPRARVLCQPILRENGGWEALCYTPRGHNHGYTLYQLVADNPAWHASYLPVTATRRDAPGESGLAVVSEADILADRGDGMSEADVLQEYYCAWDTPMPGAVYGEELRRAYAEHRIAPLLPQAGYPVQTCWDIGPAHTAIWFFQVLPGSDGRAWYHFLDYLENEPLAIHSLPYWVQQVRQKPYAYDHALLGQTRDHYEQHWGPHDLDHPDYGTGKTRATISREAVTLEDGRQVAGLRFTVVPQGPVEDGIETVRKILGRARFCSVRCEAGLNALNSYAYEWDEVLKRYSTHPVHNWASHGADALRTGAVGLLPLPGPGKPRPEGNSFDYWRAQARKARTGGTPTTFRR